MTTTPSRDERLAAETPVRDRVAYFWQLLSTEHVRIRVDLRREIGHDAPDGPTVYWDCSSFSNDVAKALLAECLAVSASDGVQGSIPDGRQPALEIIEQNCWDLRCVSLPTGAGDADIGWEIVEHHMAPPKERIIGRGNSPMKAFNEALGAPENVCQPPESGER